jgi:hypothetical protein
MAPPPRQEAAARPTPPPIGDVHRVSPERRAEIHRLILAGLARREAERTIDPPPDDPLALDEGLDDDEVSLEAMNRWNQTLMQRLDEELAPLTDECFETALARAPDLAWFVEVELTVVADEEFGGLIETVEMGARNEATDPEFIECLSESILSTALPPPPFSGRRPIVMAKQFE